MTEHQKKEGHPAPATCDMCGGTGMYGPDAVNCPCGITPAPAPQVGVDEYRLHVWTRAGICEDCRCTYSGLSRVDPCPGKTPAPQTKMTGSELLTTIKEFALWHHRNEMTIADGKKPSDTEIDFEATLWNKIERALSMEGQP